MPHSICKSNKIDGRGVRKSKDKLERLKKREKQRKRVSESEEIVKEKERERVADREREREIGVKRVKVIGGIK